MKQVYGRFPSKLLLFGEYILMYGSKALSIPFPGKGGTLIMPGRRELLPASHKESNKSLSGFYSYLCNISSELPEGFLLDEMNSAIEQGLYFDSDIPEGYGLGSSGALVAAVYQAFRGKQATEAKPVDLSLQKRIFAKMESYFHGQSSGIDPLSSWMGKPLLFSAEEKVGFLPGKIPPESLNYVFLIDTGIKRKTAGLVQFFSAEMKKMQFRNEIMENYLPLSDLCIQAFTQEPDLFLDRAADLSRFQYRYFRKMIPESIDKIWKNGMECGDYTLKLCGAGGGGYMICFSNDHNRTKSTIAQTGLKLLKLE